MLRRKYWPLRSGFRRKGEQGTGVAEKAPSSEALLTRRNNKKNRNDENGKENGAVNALRSSGLFPVARYEFLCSRDDSWASKTPWNPQPY